jgi:hypothetical protein
MSPVLTNCVFVSQLTAICLVLTAAAAFTFTALSDFSNFTLTDITFYSANATVYRMINKALLLLWFLNCPLTCVFIWDFSGRRSHRRPLKRLLDVRDDTGSTLDPSVRQLRDDEDENVSTIFVHYRGEGVLVFQLRFLKHSPTSHEIIRCCLSGSST